MLSAARHGIARCRPSVSAGYGIRGYSSRERRDADVLVIGGGHAGCEGAAAAARCGVRSILLTHRADTIGEMSCNPSFGGIGKGHLIREVDALDGLCARICDKSAITYQALNRAQGPAVLGLRAQIDRGLYKTHMQAELASTPNLDIVEGAVEELLIGEGQGGQAEVRGVRLSDGRTISAHTILISTGTFLGGEIFLGMERWPAGRIGEKSALGLSASFAKIGFQLGRLRTGTPPRLHKDTIDFSKLQLNPPDEKPIPFSFMTDEVWIPPSQQLPTYLCQTNDRVTAVVEANLGQNEHVASETTGPRYCPSIESKVIRFRHLHHRMFLEHEGLDSPLIYPQGMSMTFKPEVQVEVMRCMPGLEKVEVTQPGYGVQYDFVDPKQLLPSLETKRVRGLFLAGQINGTTGYEEAAAQGVMAGINAAARAKREQPLVLNRTEAYIGVLIDDLTSLGTNEPYRMFTSRAECRLHLRPDNADIRLTEKGRAAGAVGEERWKRFEQVKSSLSSVQTVLSADSRSLHAWKRAVKGLETKKTGVMSGLDLLHRHGVSLEQLAEAIPQLAPFVSDSCLEERLRIEGSYAAMHERMKIKTAELERESLTSIPEDMDYSRLQGMSLECMEKLDRARPLNLAAATRIPGVTPEAISVLLRHLKRPSVFGRGGE